MTNLTKSPSFLIGLKRCRHTICGTPDTRTHVLESGSDMVK